MQSIIDNLLTITPPKVIVSVGLFIAFMFGEIHQFSILAVLVLLVLDTILGTMASKYNNEPITSKRFARAVHKSFVYFSTISASYFTDVAIKSIGIAPFEPVVIGFIAVTEFISILENVGRMGYPVPRKLLNQLNGIKKDYDR